MNSDSGEFFLLGEEFLILACFCSHSTFFQIRQIFEGLRFAMYWLENSRTKRWGCFSGDVHPMVETKDQTSP